MKLNCCWLYAISRYGYPPSWNGTLKAIREMKAMGFDAVELEGVREPNLLEVSDRRGELGHFCRELGLEVMNFCPVLPDLVSLNRTRRRKAQALFRTGAELADFFGSAFVQIDSFTAPLHFRGAKPYSTTVRFDQKFEVRIPKGFEWRDQWDALTESAGYCKKIANRLGLTLLLEPRVGELVSNTEGMLRLMDAIGPKGFGVVLDTGHQNGQKELLPLSVMKLGTSIKYVHASDNDGRTQAHQAIGDGTIDWPGLFDALNRVGFDGWVGVDVGRVPNIMSAYRRSRTALTRLMR